MPNLQTDPRPKRFDIAAQVAEIAGLLDWVDGVLRDAQLPVRGPGLEDHDAVGPLQGAVRRGVVPDVPVDVRARQHQDDGPVRTSLLILRDGVQVDLVYGGRAFDPTGPQEPPEPSAETLGGHGLALVRAFSRTFEYRRAGARNHVTLEFEVNGLRSDPT